VNCAERVSVRSPDAKAPVSPKLVVGGIRMELERSVVLVVLVALRDSECGDKGKVGGGSELLLYVGLYEA
jgi:hypothetical protein